MDSTSNAVVEAIDGATGDWTMSGDAMRWSPEVAARAAQPGSSELPGLEVAAGIGAGQGLDMDALRRHVSGALTSMGAVAGDMLSEIRQLTGGSDPDDTGR